MFERELPTDSSDRNQAESSLRASDQKLAAVLRISPDAIVIASVIDGNYQFIDINDKYAEITGYSYTEVIGNKFLELDLWVNPELRNQFWQLLQQHRRIENFEYQIRQKSGRILTLLMSAEAFYIDGQEYVIKISKDISDRKVAEIALQDSNASLCVAQQVAHIGSWEFEVQTQKINWSEELYRLFGLDPSQPTPPYSEYLQKIHPEDRPILLQCVEQAIANGTSYTIDYRAILPNGSIRHHEGRGESSRDAQGKVSKLYGTALDITDRKKAEDVLQNLVKGTASVAGKDFFPALAQYLATGLSVSHALVTELIDGQLYTRVFWTGHQLQPNFSYSPENSPCQLTLRNGMYFHPEHVQQEFPDNDELKILEAESYFGIALTDTAGKPIGLICILDHQPLTNLSQLYSILQVFAARASAELERERALQALQCLNQELEQRVEQRTIALRASESRYRALMDGASDAILIADAQGNLIEVNRKAQELLGYTCDELAQMHISQIHPPEVLEEIIIHFSAVIQKREESLLSNIALRKDGSHVPIEFTCSVIELGGEQFAQCIFRDVTERRRAELELLHSRDLREVIYHESTDALFLVDPVSLLILDCNQRSLEMFEACSREELIGIGGDTLQKYSFTDDELKTIVEDIREFGFWRREVEYITQKGNKFWGNLAVKSINVAGADMNLVRVTDISDRKQTEAFLELQNRCLGCVAIGDPLPQTISLLTELLELDIDRSLCSALILDNQDRLRSITATHLSANCNLPLDGMTLSEGMILFGENPLNVIDIDTNPYWQNYRDLALSNALKTCWAIPIFVSDSQKIAGIFTLYFREPRPPLAYEIKVAKFVAYTAGVAIQQANIYQQLQNELASKEKLFQQLSSELNQKKVLLKEIHHRVKNNLQVMSSILYLQFRNTSPEVKAISEECQNRIESMALIHDQLHRSDDLANIDFQKYIANLTSNLFQCYGTNPALIKLNLEIDNIFLPLDQSIPLGLILTELLSNSLKHAFPQRYGEITIRLLQSDQQCSLIVSDNGVGIPPNIDLQNTGRVGMELVYSLVDQLEGELTFTSIEGVSFLITFPVL
jgi:PAS domain S-box-containing protein